jgi:hypothetical protein
MTLDRPTRFVAAWAFGPTEDALVPELVETTRRRTEGGAGAQWISDGKPVYRREVRRVYRDPRRTGRRGRPRLEPTPGVALTQAVKQREGGRVVQVEVRAVIGEAPECPYAVCEERLNGVLRDRLNCLTRKTHAFAKRQQTWDAAVALCLFGQNWLRPHRALRREAEGLPNGQRYLRRTPAMAQGLTDHVWTWTEFLLHPTHHYKKE